MTSIMCARCVGNRYVRLVLPPLVAVCTRRLLTDSAEKSVTSEHSDVSSPAVCASVVSPPRPAIPAPVIPLSMVELESRGPIPPPPCRRPERGDEAR